MTFAYPLVLVALVVPAALCVLVWRRHGHAVVMPFDHAGQPPGTALKVVLNAVATLPPLLLAVAILMLAGPQQLSEPKSQKVMTNIQFCLDVSGSMASNFGDGTRYEGAMEAITGFVDAREGDAFGLTVFGGHYIHWIRLTDDPSAFKYAMPFLAPDKMPRWFSGGTAIAMALDKCVDVMAEREKGDRVVVLFSDGYSGDIAGSGGDRIAAKLVANEIKLYAVHVAGGAAPPDLARLAAATGGAVFAAGDPQALDVVFANIDEMEKTEIEKVSAESMDNFRPLAIAGLSALALLLAGSLAGLRYNPW